jgi:hypothetical protein
MKQSIQSGTFSSKHSATTARERIPRVSLIFTSTDSGELNERWSVKKIINHFRANQKNKTQRRIL